MVHLIKSYFKFLWKSKNEYSVHSPFVFDLLTKCVYDTARYPEYATLERYRKSLSQNREFVDVTDFGAGSRVFKSNHRKVSDIAKNAGISRQRAELLFRLTKYFNPETILEIGTSLGLATSCLSVGNPSAKIITLEGCAQTANVAKKQFEKFHLKNIDVIVGEFDSYLRNSLTIDQRTISFDLIFFDGNHTKAATQNYFESLLPTATNDSLWIFDDIHWSAEMEEAWEIIKENPKVSVTIDTFQWGLVFFREEQRKEHFVLRT